MTIHIYVHPQVDIAPIRNVQLSVATTMVNDHQQGKHPWGSMRRECPLCQAGR